MTRHFIATALAASLLLSLASPAARAVDTDMAINTTSIDFGQVSLGSTAQASVTLTNTGGDPFGPINIFGGAPPTNEFNASQSCQGNTLAPGGSCTVNYEFSPDSSGSFNDTSSFTISETNSQFDGEDFSVSLTGVGRCVGRLCGVIPLCQLSPSLCDNLPVLEQAPVDPTDPTDPADPTDPGETAPSFDHELTGTARLKGQGLKASQPYALQLSFDPTAGTFLAMDAAGTVYTGNLARKGTKGDKFRLFPDGASDDALAADVAARAGGAAGRSAGTVLGQSSKLTLKLLEDGSVALKVKSEVLTSGIGEVVFKANLTGAPPAQ